MTMVRLDGIRGMIECHIKYKVLKSALTGDADVMLWSLTK